MERFTGAQARDGDGRRSVLIIEDEASIREALEELFDVDGSQVSSAATLPEALAALRAGTFDFIVTDIRLGGNRDGGLQVLAAAAMVAADTPVVVLTAFPDEDNRLASSRLSAAHFLGKPVDLATIASLAAQHGVPSAVIPSASR